MEILRRWKLRKKLMKTIEKTKRDGARLSDLFHQHLTNASAVEILEMLKELDYTRQIHCELKPTGVRVYRSPKWV